MSIEVEGPDGVILEFPDGTSRETMAKAMAKRYPKGGAKAKPAPKASEPSAVASFGKGLLSGAANALLTPAELLVRGMAALGTPGAEEGAARSAADRARADRGLAAYRQTSPNAFAGGRLIGEVAASAPMVSGVGNALIRGGGGGALVTRAPAAAKALRAVGTATKTSGIGSGRTAAQTAALTKSQRAAALAARAAGGAVAGGVGAAATGQNPIEGAAVGAALPVAVSGAAKIGGRIVDMFRADKVRAAALFRKALGEDLDAARAAFTQLAPDDQRLARKVLIDEGVEPDTFMALGATMERVKPEQTRKIVEAETAAARQGLEAAAGVGGGGSATDVRAAVRGGRKAVSQAMSPARETAFENITNVNRAVSDAEMLAQAARERADEQSGLARRMVFGMDRAETRLGQMDDLGDQFNPQALNAARGQVGAMGQRAEAAAQEAISARGVAADMEDYIHQIAAADVRPQRGAPLINALRSMAGQPGTRMDDLQRGTILRVAKKIESAMDENGLINPYDMYQLRKTGINDIVEGFQKKITAGTEPRSGNVQRAEQLAGSVRNMIDDTLGPEFKDYLARSAQGYQVVNRQELAGEALKRFKEPSSASFLKLVGGDDPKAVAKIMKGGPEQENIGNALTAQMSVPFTEAANLLQGRNRMAELATSGTAAAADLMNTETPRKLRAATRVALSAIPTGRIALEGAEQLTGDFMRPRIRERLAEGFLSGRGAAGLLDVYPQSILTDEQISKLAPYQRNLLAQSLRNYFTSPDANAMAGY
jgi:hypothetical protein